MRRIIFLTAVLVGCCRTESTATESATRPQSSTESSHNGLELKIQRLDSNFSGYVNRFENDEVICYLFAYNSNGAAISCYWKQTGAVTQGVEPPK